MAAATPPYTLPYSLKTLSWDAQHIFNVQNKYSYTGKGRKLGDPCLQCDLCEQWFHLRDVSCVPADAGFVAFQRNYRFSCRVCTQGPEQFELQENTWTSVVLTAIYNLLLTDDNSALRAGDWLKVRDVVQWLQEHGGSLTTGRDLSQLRENSAVQKCIQYPQTSGAGPSALFSLSEDRSEVLLKHVAPSKLLLKPLVSSAVPGALPGVKPKKADAAARTGLTLESAPKELSLKRVLADSKALADFMAYAQADLSSENLEFWVEVNAFRAAWDGAVDAARDAVRSRGTRRRRARWASRVVVEGAVVEGVVHRGDPSAKRRDARARSHRERARERERARDRR